MSMLQIDDVAVPGAQQPGARTASAVSPATLRRRRVIVALTALTAVAAAASVAVPSPAAFAALATMVTVAVGYATLLHRSRRVATEREFRGVGLGGPAAMGGGDLAESDGFERFVRHLAGTAVSPERPGDDMAGAGPATATAPAWRQAVTLARFLVSYAAGWALAPLVFALTLLVGRTPRDTTGQRWLANLEAAQTRLRDQSMRTLAVSAATTASVAGVGTIAVLGGAGVASAAPIAASAGIGIPSATGVGAPAAAGVGMAGSAGLDYQVAAGDTLSLIAARYGTTWEALAAANDLADPNLIYVGQELLIPGAHAATAGTNSTAGSIPTGAEGTSTGSAAPSTYTVVAGDTLSSIAARFGTTWQSLAQINGLADPDVIEVGQVLRLDGPAAGSTGAATVASPATAPMTGTPATSATPNGTGGGTPAPAAAGGAAVAVREALAQVGKPYVWAGAGPNDFDCSGLVMYAWAAAGVSLPHYTVSQYEDTARISESELQPGDLVFYDTGDGAQPGHVTMYIGGGQIVTADSPGTDVRVEALDWDGTPMGFGRVG